MASFGMERNIVDECNIKDFQTDMSRSASSSGTSDSSGSTAAATGTSGTGAASKAGAAIDDSVITTKVKTALLADPDVKSTDISVETLKGEVILSGFVRNPVQIDRALKIARGVEGVKGVQNKLSVKKS